jgi:hypothetical protein
VASRKADFHTGSVTLFFSLRNARELADYDHKSHLDSKAKKSSSGKQHR